MKKKRSGFTLVELLVVVSIIVVLLAMLLPALDRAIYEATLVSCAARLKGNAAGLHLYTGDFKRYYPDRKLETLKNMIPPALATGVVQAQETGGWDTRPALKGYIQINKQLNDPFLDAVDLEYVETPPNTLVYCPYALYYGWFYRHGKGGTGLFKLGDRWEWNKRKYSILIADYELFWTAPNNNIAATHPDMYGGRHVMTSNAAQNVFAPSHAQNVTISAWRLPGSFDRALLDMNYAYDDGSVQQVRQARPRDERYDIVPYYFNGSKSDPNGAGPFIMFVPR